MNIGNNSAPHRLGLAMATTFSLANFDFCAHFALLKQCRE
jgi:hypothetical protein